jgi:glycosyltransferase involved in cell wall biosynthesis
MTAMVRDEADIIAPMLEHHLAQGVDQFVITDNGSVDGTTEILERFAADGVVDLRHDPEHRKQQARLVTGMARDAYTQHGADWVLNADADEFWLPVGDGTFKDTLAEIPVELGAFQIPVIDMTGPAAGRGTGLQRLVYRDLRSDEALREAGLRAHSSPNVVHVGSADVEVSQGNHEVSIPGGGTPDPAHALEVLHFPWRSWEQYERKVRNTGESYLASPELTPSPNHHGMADYRRLLEGTLMAYYLLRHPSDEELAAAVASGDFVEDRRIADRVPSPVADTQLELTMGNRELRSIAREATHDRGALIRARRELEASTAARAELERHVADLTGRVEALSAELDSTGAEYTALKNRKAVRFIDATARIVRR